MLSGLLRLFGGSAQKQRVAPNANAVQISGDHNTVLFAGEVRLPAERRHARRTEPRSLRELMLTELRATELVGRQEELAALRAWMTATRAARDISVHCLTGQGGAGKTRLAIELCEWAESAGWIAGFVRQEEFARFHDRHNASEWRWQKQTLVVLDYAAASAQVLRSCLEALARGAAAPNEPPLRILLLERHADRDSGWWSDLIRPGGLSGPGAGALIDHTAPLSLGPLRAAADRRALLAQAMEKAAPLLDPPQSPPALPPPGADPLFDRRLEDDTIETEPLFLVMAGIVAAEQGAPTALALGRLNLANTVADAERSRLQRLARANGADASLLFHLAACITLQAGCRRDMADALIEQERQALGDRSAIRTDQLAAVLCDALAAPDGDGIDAVRPDLIGEAFTLNELMPSSRRVEAVERAFRRSGPAVIANVIRTAQDHAQGEASHASVAWLQHLADLTDDPFALMAIGYALPKETLALRERATEISRRIAAGLADLAAAEPDVKPLHAGWTSNLAVRLSDLGEREAALAAAREAADLYRTLEAQRPDAFRPDLAMSLSNLANRLSELGEREAALAAAREAADLYRALAAQRPDAFRPDLAMSLNNLANSLSELDEREAALAAAREAADLYRTLAAQRPDAFRPYLAVSLNNLANMLSELGEREAALAAAREAADLSRALAAQRPDAFRPDLARSLSNLAVMLSELGEREAALAAAREAVNIRRALAAQRPDAFRPNLATSLRVLANCLDAAGRQDEGLTASAEAIAALSGIFQQHKGAFAGRIVAMASEYLQRCEALGREPDQELLEPVIAGLATLQADRLPDGQPGERA
jgi:tetratricopeptide (TPR) repeat protein